MNIPGLLLASDWAPSTGGSSGVYTLGAAQAVAVPTGYSSARFVKFQNAGTAVAYVTLNNSGAATPATAGNGHMVPAGGVLYLQVKKTTSPAPAASIFGTNGTMNVLWAL